MPYVSLLAVGFVAAVGVVGAVSKRRVRAAQNASRVAAERDEACRRRRKEQEDREFCAEFYELLVSQSAAERDKIYRRYRKEKEDRELDAEFYDYY